MKISFYDYFIPHDGNDFHPHLLQKVSIAAMMFLVLLSFITANIQALIWVNVDWLVGAVLPAVIVDKTNIERSSDDLGSLTRSTILDQAAQMKADDMAKNSYFAHYSPEGVSPWYWFNQAGYNYLYAGENLAVHFTDSKEVVKAWMKSPTHRANILNGTYTEIGIGIAKGKYEGYDTIFVVQLFGTPSSLAPVVAKEEIKTVETPKVTLIDKNESLAEVAGVSESEKVEVVEEIAVEAPKESVVDFVDLIEATPPEIVEETAEEVITPIEESILATETLTTTTVPASIENRNVLEKSPWYSFVTQPLVVLQLIYLVIASVVLVILLVSLWLEWRRHNPLQVVYSGGLLVTMAALFYLNTLIVGGAVLV